MTVCRLQWIGGFFSLVLTGAVFLFISCDAREVNKEQMAKKNQESEKSRSIDFIWLFCLPRFFYDKWQSKPFIHFTKKYQNEKSDSISISHCTTSVQCRALNPLRDFRLLAKQRMKTNKKLPILNILFAFWTTIFNWFFPHFSLGISLWFAFASIAFPDVNRLKGNEE